MVIRKLEQSEKLLTRELYEGVFKEDSKGFVDYYYTEKIKDNQIYVVEEDGKICSMLHLNPYKLSVNDLPKITDFIVAVATQKESRGKGYMSAMLKKVLCDQYAEGKTFTYLMAASEAIYAPFDFCTVLKRQVGATWKEEELPEGICAREASPKEYKAIAEKANEVLKAYYNVFAFRSEKFYARYANECESDDGKLMVLERDGQIVNALGWFPGEETGFEAPYMVRVIDVKKMLLSLRLNTLTAVCFCVTDPLIQENNRCVVLTGTEFSGVMFMGGKEENSEGTLTISALTKLVFGLCAVEELCDMDGVSMTERMKSELKKMVPLEKVYFNEMV